MAKITVDGTEYELPKMKFKTLKKAFPIVMAVQETDDPIAMADAAIQVISLAAIKKFPEMTPEWLEENMDADEVKGVTATMIDLMIEAGLMTRADATTLLGEAAGAPPAPPSTETLTPSSQNSLQPVAAEETGTQ